MREERWKRRLTGATEAENERRADAGEEETRGRRRGRDSRRPERKRRAQAEAGEEESRGGRIGGEPWRPERKRGVRRRLAERQRGRAEERRRES